MAALKSVLPIFFLLIGILAGSPSHAQIIKSAMDTGDSVQSEQQTASPNVPRQVTEATPTADQATQQVTKAPTREGQSARQQAKAQRKAEKAEKALARKAARQAAILNRRIQKMSLKEADKIKKNEDKSERRAEKMQKASARKAARQEENRERRFEKLQRATARRKAQAERRELAAIYAERRRMREEMRKAAQERKGITGRTQIIRQPVVEIEDPEQAAREATERENFQRRRLDEQNAVGFMLDGLIDGYKRRMVESKTNIYQDLYSCVAFNGHHVSTFDLAQINFRGECEYILSRGYCESDDDCAFDVTFLADAEQGAKTSRTKAVYVLMFGLEIAIFRGGLIMINNVRQHLPVSMQDKFSIVQNLQSITFSSQQCGVSVVFWEDFAVQVLVPEGLYTLDGLCGNCDGVHGNDYVNSHGKNVESSRHRGTKVARGCQTEVFRPGLPVECQHRNHHPVSRECTNKHDKPGAEAACLILTQHGGPFQACSDLHGRLVHSVFETCVSAFCASGPEEFLEEDFLCSLLSHLSELCWQGGVLLEEWRDQAGCATECPENAHFAQYTPACASTCLSIEQPKGHCEADTQAGCQCDHGHIMESGNCIPIGQCGCVYSLYTYIPLQTSVLTKACHREISCDLDEGSGMARWKMTHKRGCGEGETCVLQDGEHSCTCKDGYEHIDGQGCKAIAPGPGGLGGADSFLQLHTGTCECRAMGDPHYVTYDGMVFHFQGKCTYTLSETIGPNLHGCGFEIKAKNNRRKGNKDVSFTKAVYIYTMDQRVFLLGDGNIMVNGLVRYAPIKMDGLSIVQSGKDVELTTDCGLSVAFDGSHKVVVRTPAIFAGQMRGLCGDCNGDGQNDLTTRQGVNVYGEENAFNLVGNSFLVVNPESFMAGPGGGEQHGCLNNQPAMMLASPGFFKEAQGPAYCGPIVDPEAIFGPCIAKTGSAAVDTFESCVMDVCAYEGKPHMIQNALCMAYEEMASVCDAEGIPVKWRTKDFCPMKCPANSEYQPSMSGCQASCGQPKPSEDCPLDPREGCKCLDGYLLDNGHCILADNCGCRDTREEYIPRGKKFVGADCTSLHECVAVHMGSMLVTTDLGLQSCSPNAYCYSGDLYNPVCVCKAGYRGDGYTCVSPLEAESFMSMLGNQDCECKISGDPHILTSDGAHLSLTQPCKYIMAESEGPSTDCRFRIEVKNERRPTFNHPNSSYVRLFDVIIGENQDHVVRLLKPDLVFVKGFGSASFQPVSLPWADVSLGVQVEADGVWMNFTSDCGYGIRFDGKSTGIMTAPVEYRNTMSGLCGNCNGQPGDDLRFDGQNVRDFDDREEGSNQLAMTFLTVDDSDVPDTSPVCTP